MDFSNNQSAFDSRETGSSNVESRRASLKGSSDNRKKEGGTLDQDGDSQVGHQLLVVGGKTQQTKLLSEGEELLNFCEGKSILLQFGKNSGVDGCLEDLEFTDTGNKVVLRNEGGEKKKKRA